MKCNFDIARKLIIPQTIHFGGNFAVSCGMIFELLLAHILSFCLFVGWKSSNEDSSDQKMFLQSATVQFCFSRQKFHLFSLCFAESFGCFGRLHRRRLWQTGGFFPPTWIKWGGSPHTLFSAEELFASSELNQTSLRKEYSVLENYYLRINSNKISKVQGVTKVLSPQHIFNITIRFIY